MMEYLMHSTIFMKAIVTCCLLGIVSFIVLEISYISMVWSTADISRSRKPWLAKLTNRYRKYHEMNIRINNVRAFVDRLFRKKRLLGFPVSFWITLEHLSIAGCAIAGAAGALVASQQGKELMDVMIIYLTGITAACFLLFLDTFLRAGEKKQIVVNNIEDYLENVLDNKFAVIDFPKKQRKPAAENGAALKKKPEGRAGSGPGKDTGTRRGEADGQRQNAGEAEGQRQKAVKQYSPPVTPEEEKLLEDVLEEFFIV